MSDRPDGWNPPIIRTVASEGSGISECIQAIETYRAFLSGSELRREETVQMQKDRLLELACLQAREALLQDDATAARIQELALLIADRKLDPFTAAEEVIRLQSDQRTASQD
jgi:LAO/AO transport system kinase